MGWQSVGQNEGLCCGGEDGPKGISAIIVEDGAPGLSFGGLEDKMGWRAQPTSQVQFDDCVVPAANLLGEEGKGFYYAMKVFDHSRPSVAAGAVGVAQRQVDTTEEEVVRVEADDLLAGLFRAQAWLAWGAGLAWAPEWASSSPPFRSSPRSRRSPPARNAGRRPPSPG